MYDLVHEDGTTIGPYENKYRAASAGMEVWGQDENWTIMLRGNKPVDPTEVQWLKQVASIRLEVNHAHLVGAV